MIAKISPSSTDSEAWHAYVYERPNPAGAHNEIWLHAGGCRAHLAVVRDTLTHEIASVRFAREHGAAPHGRRKPGAKA